MKQIEVQDGLFKGKLAVILGTDFDYYGKSVMSLNEPIGRDYSVRWAHTPEWEVTDKVYIANIEGQLVALNQRELKKPKASKETSEEPKAEVKSEKKGKEEK